LNFQNPKLYVFS